MNDPLTGRMLSPDILIHDEHNPLRYTDPMNTSNGNITVNIENIYTDYFAPISIE
ncbi:MAG: hypothetical protein MJZ85_03435 [Bacteroidales bacterium]|nr:hypothetical protein [Bacteroidales bacterium]